MNFFKKLFKSNQYRLLHAIETGNVLEVKELLDQRVDANAKSESNLSPLYFVSDMSNEHLKIVRMLIEKGADVNFQYYDKFRIQKIRRLTD